MTGDYHIVSTAIEHRIIPEGIMEANEAKSGGKMARGLFLPCKKLQMYPLEVNFSNCVPWRPVVP